MTDRARYQQLDEIFMEAGRRPQSERDAFVRSRCGDDDGLLQEVLALLAADAVEAGPLDATLAVPPSMAAALPPVRSDTPAAALPEAIDGYRVIRRLGAGGMGVVYEAEQETPRRRVALKIINQNVITPDALRRFALEAEVLGRLQHPGIAQIHGAGTVDLGSGPQPYFVMELIEGTPLTTYADRNACSSRDRLELLARVCDGAHHAHQRGVIHRDLKPGNVLVTGDGQPKILDFGIARSTDDDARRATLMTQAGQIVGTVPYMSPEQATGDSAAIDTRSDVYSLGVLGYELLTGHLPHDVSDKLLHEALRVIREEEPTPLTSHDRLLGGDIATIIGTALERDMERRYPSAATMADDVRRYLGDEPISARPPSVLYQLRKFSKRHRGVVAALAGLFLVISLFAVAATAAAVRERDLRGAAEVEARVARSVSDFLRFDMIGAAAPDQIDSADTTIGEVLDRAASEIEHRFLDDPEVHAAIRQTIGDTYVTLARFDDAADQFDAAAAVLAEIDNPRWRGLADLGNSRAKLAVEMGDYETAEPLIEAALLRKRNETGPDSLETLKAEFTLATLFYRSGRLEESIALYESILERLDPEDEGAPLLRLEVMNSLSISYESVDRLDDALRVARETLAERRALLGDNHWDTLNSMINLGYDLSQTGADDAEAEAIMLDARRRFAERGAPAGHPMLAALENNLALLYLYSGRFADAEPIFRRLLATGREVEGPEHPNTLNTMHNLASVLWQTERLDEAHAMFTETLAARVNTLGPAHPETLLSHGLLARVTLDRGDLDEGIDMMRVAYERMRDDSPFGPAHTYTIRTGQNLAGALRAAGRDDEAAAVMAGLPKQDETSD